MGRGGQALVGHWWHPTGGPLVACHQWATVCISQWATGGMPPVGHHLSTPVGHWWVPGGAPPGGHRWKGWTKNRGATEVCHRWPTGKATGGPPVAHRRMLSGRFEVNICVVSGEFHLNIIIQGTNGLLLL